MAAVALGVALLMVVGPGAAPPAPAARAAPTWMGVYGAFERHDGANPGTYTVLMNQDYWGLHAEVGVRVDGGSWTTHGMSYAGNDSGNSIWTYSPSGPTPPGSAARSRTSRRS